MQVFINPGSGPVADATAEQAEINMAAFLADLAETSHPATGCTRLPGADYGNGRFAFQLAMVDGRTIEIQMPGVPLDCVRWVDPDSQNIWDFPRLYVDDSSWVWKFAVSACEPEPAE